MQVSVNVTFMVSDRQHCEIDDSLGEIIRTAIIDIYIYSICTVIIGSSCNFWFKLFFVFCVS